MTNWINILGHCENHILKSDRFYKQLRYENGVDLREISIVNKLDNKTIVTIKSDISTYGGRDGLFQIDPSIEDIGCVEGFLTEEQAIEVVDIIMNKY